VPLPPALPAAALAPTADAVTLPIARDDTGYPHAAATQRAYRSDWADFSLWCRSTGWPPLPAAPQAIAAYFASMAATHRRSTIRRRLAAIGQAHRRGGFAWTPSHPLIRTALRDIARRPDSAVRPSAALTRADLCKLVATCADDLAGLRDRALLLVGFAGALRRSELVGIDREHLVSRHTGLQLTLPGRKDDPDGVGVDVSLRRDTCRETCPVRALEAWLVASDCPFGPVFRKVDLWGNIEHRRLNPDAVREILLRRAKQAGITVPAGERLSPHGLRAGFVAEATMVGVCDAEIMAHTRHADQKTMRRSVRGTKPATRRSAKPLEP
jgi:site-specific recombinase XerD